MARACLDVVEKYAVCDPINIASGNLVTIGESVDLILKYANHNVTPQYDETMVLEEQSAPIDEESAVKEMRKNIDRLMALMDDGVDLPDNTIRFEGDKTKLH